jgi:hypothetical protein
MKVIFINGNVCLILEKMFKTNQQHAGNFFKKNFMRVTQSTLSNEFGWEREDSTKSNNE